MTSSPSSPSPSHWVESLFPAQYSIRDYRATFQPDHQRVRRYITTLSSFDAPTLAAIYEQSYLFTLIQRLAKQEEDEKIKSKTKTKANQTESVDSVLDIRLIRAYLEKHKEKEETIDQTENLWSSDEIAIIRSAYMKIRDDCLRLKSENEYYRKEHANIQNKLIETNQTLEKLQEEYFALKKIHMRWTLRTNSSEQLLDEQRQENKELIQHIEKLTEQNETYRRDHLKMQANLLEKQTRLEYLERKIDQYDQTIKRECDRRIDLVEKRAQVDKDRFKIEQNNLQTKLDKEHDLRRQNLLALDQLRKHIALANPQTNEESLCDIKHVKYV
jgi:chromosome segregation ATPase